MKPVWATRTGTSLSGAFAAFSETTQDDLPYLQDDVTGSIAHVLGLQHVGLLDAAAARSLVAGLQDVLAQHNAGTFSLDAGLEDVHMNIEAHLTAALGDVGKRLHTGRSRNDQVATCITLHARRQVLSGLAALGKAQQALVGLAAQHQATPWVARTHGQPAQPATLGFLFMAHAFRLQSVQDQGCFALQQIDESPLGSGAVAGSTLPLDPAFTAGLMGLQPPQNALRMAGSRDHALAAIQWSAQVGFAVASLAQDLLDLHAQGTLKLASEHTTGSSLMPHKRNPDALELLRGHAKALSAASAAPQALLTGLGMGYMRDMQAIKPHLTAAMQEGIDVLALLADVLQGATATPAALDAPGITATDAVEALVAHGVPFRTAYEALAAAHKAAEDGVAVPASLQASGLPEAAVAAAIAALVPEPMARQTLGAPGTVAAQIAAFEAHAHAIQADVRVFQQRAQHASRLTTTPPEELVA